MKGPSIHHTLHDLDLLNTKTCRLNRWAFAIRPQEKNPVALIRATLRIILIIVHEFFSTHITIRASALSFTIIMSMIPMLAMSTAILKGLGNENQLKTAAYLFIDQLDPQVTSAETTPAQGETPPSPEDVATPPAMTLNNHLHNAVDTIFNYVDNTNFAALGAFGIIGLLFTVILVLSSVEEAMNAIWHTKRGRSLFRKVMDYLALLIVLPISINVAIAGEAILKSPLILGYVTAVIPSVWAVHMLFKLLPFVFITLSLMLMYLFFPHVRVKTSAALSGAIFASVFWFIVQRAYIILQIGVAKYNAIYGSFATVPLFLIWVYLGWTFILLGAVLAHAIQNHKQYQLPGRIDKPQHKLQRAFDVLLAIYKNFIQTQLTTMDTLQNACPHESRADLFQTLAQLKQGKMIYTVRRDGSTIYMPSRPAAKVSASDVVTLILGHDPAKPTAGGNMTDRIIKDACQVISTEEFPGLPHNMEPLQRKNNFTPNPTDLSH